MRNNKSQLDWHWFRGKKDTLFPFMVRAEAPHITFTRSDDGFTQARKGFWDPNGEVIAVKRKGKWYSPGEVKVK